MNRNDYSDFIVKIKPFGVQLLAVSKTKSVEEIQAL